MRIVFPKEFQRQTAYLGLLHGVFVGVSLIIFSLVGFTPNYAQQTVYGDPPPQRIFGQLSPEQFVLYAVVGMIIILGTYGGLNYVINRTVRLLIPPNKTEWRYILHTLYQTEMSMVFVMLVLLWTSELHEFPLEFEKIIITMVAPCALLSHLLLLTMCIMGTIFSRQVVPYSFYLVLVAINIVQLCTWVVSISPHAPAIYAINVISTFGWLIFMSLYWLMETSHDTPTTNPR